MNRREFLKFSSTMLFANQEKVISDERPIKLDTNLVIPRVSAVLFLILALVSSRNPLVQDFFQKLEDLVIRPEKNEK